jgi:hypothetical protein
MAMDAGAGDANANQAITQYLDRVKELVPAEITAAFLAINTAVPLDDRWKYFLYGFSFLLAIACWLYLRRFKGVTSFQQLFFVTCIAFPVWAFNIAISRFDFVANATFIPSSTLVLVTVFAPLFAGPRS